MLAHPAITEALAAEHRRDLITQANASRLAREARGGRPCRSGLSRIARRTPSAALRGRRAVTTAAAAFAVAALLMISLAGHAHVFAAHVYAVHFAAHLYAAQHGAFRWAAPVRWASHLFAHHFV